MHAEALSLRGTCHSAACAHAVDLGSVRVQRTTGGAAPVCIPVTPVAGSTAEWQQVRAPLFPYTAHFTGTPLWNLRSPYRCLMKAGAAVAPQSIIGPQRHTFS